VCANILASKLAIGKSQAGAGVEIDLVICYCDYVVAYGATLCIDRTRRVIRMVDGIFIGYQMLLVLRIGHNTG
jgi:hypothetical protein